MSQLNVKNKVHRAGFRTVHVSSARDIIITDDQQKKQLIRIDINDLQKSNKKIDCIMRAIEKPARKSISSVQGKL